MADSKETMKPKGYQESKQKILLLVAVQLRLARASYSECTEAIRRSESFADSHGNIEFITLLLSSIDNDSSVHAHVATRAAIRIWAFDSDPVAAMACC